MQWTHPSTLEALHVQPEEMGEGGTVPLLDAPNVNGAVFGFDFDNKAVVKNIFQPFLKCSLDVNCIAPEGTEKVISMMIYLKKSLLSRN